MTPHGKWNIWIDTGGTFTDCISEDPDGSITRIKVLSNSTLRGKVKEVIDKNRLRFSGRLYTDKDIFRGFSIRFLPDGPTSEVVSADLTERVLTINGAAPSPGTDFELTSGEEVPILAARIATGTSLKESFPPIDMRLGSTRGTNALLERKGARVAFLVTKGFRDLILIGNQQRPDLFALKIDKPTPLYEDVFEIPERIGANGKVISEPDLDEVRKLLTTLGGDYDAVAVALMNSYRNGEHEQLIKDMITGMGMEFISISSEIAPEIKILHRAETTIVNAYLSTVIDEYISNITNSLKAGHLKVMSSAGGLLEAGHFKPKDSLLSGPAGGLLGAVHIARSENIEQILTLDMGGTSTDVAHYDNKFDYEYLLQVGDASILSPAFSITTIAAGGGSICSFDGYKFTVGPESAGAHPGPACYGAGGPMTITDVNLLLGRLDVHEFNIPVNIEESKRALEALQTKAGDNRTADNEAVLEGLLSITNEKMAEAIRKISIRRGYNPHDYTLVAFGGAGGQHACAVAELLGIRSVIVPMDAGLLSAYGIGQSEVESFHSKQILELVDHTEDRLNLVIDELKGSLRSKFHDMGYDEKEVKVRSVLFYLRYQGQDTNLEVEYTEGLDLRKAFSEKYLALIGQLIDRPVEIESVKIIGYIPGPEHKSRTGKLTGYTPVPERGIRSRIVGKWIEVPVYSWKSLRAGAFIEGPALVSSETCTVFADPGWELMIDEGLNCRLSFGEHGTGTIAEHPEEVNLELFTNRFTAIATEMGALLERTSFSVNVKERLDFSCAILDKNGYLVVNAPHIPVHLGSLGICVRSVVGSTGIREGEIIMTNHPAFGGSHLPDVTLIAPVYHSGELIAYVANRAHHAEIGGKRPGSMPVDATSLAEEGVIIPPVVIGRNMEVNWNQVEKIFADAPFPSRSVIENIADLKGAVAAILEGVKGIHDLAEKFGAENVWHYMEEVGNYAAFRLRSVLKEMDGNSYQAEEKMDDGTIIRVGITIGQNAVTFDFTGSDSVHPGNLNATIAIVNSAVLYILRVLVDEAIPLNEGLMRSVELILPECFLSPTFPQDPDKCPAVVGGNTETSQRLVDTMIKALGLAACSQGTMNNLVFGDEKFGYYETICGGTGAGNGFPGADAVHHHMTNTRITDPEVIELRYPVQLIRFEIRPESGGKGEFHGGNGITREFLFNTPVDVNILSQHRVESPFGLKGGEPGKCGTQFIHKKNGEIIEIQGITASQLQKGDRLIINTPGGGGYGPFTGK